MSANRKLLSIFFSLGLAFAARDVSAESNDFASLSLRQAINRAVERSVLVVESTLEWRRAQGSAEGVAGVLAENPLLSAEGGLHRDVGWSGNQAALGLRLEQPFDLLGQAGTRRQAASDLVGLAKARLSLARAEVAARVHLVYTMIQVARVRVSLEEERLTTARQTGEALQMRARLGASSDIDLRMAMAEIGRAEAALQDARAAVTRATLALREVLELPASAAALASDGFQPPPSSLPEGQPQGDLFTHHLAVKVVEGRRLAIDSEIARLERERLPRVSLGLFAERASQYEHLLGLTFSVSPAVWRRNQGPLAEAKIERERADFEKAVTLAGLERRFAALAEEQSQRITELRAVEGTLENEEQVRALVREGWQAGKFDFLRVLLAERSVADTKRTRLELWADLWSNIIEMNRLLGREP